MSGGYSGQVSVYGLPSGRLLKLIPVFSQFAEDAYGYDAETKPLLETTYGFVPWDDSHHPELSMTDGVPDGRWLFINANNTPRIARIDLTRFETDEIIQIPNSAGGHASPFTTPNTKYVVIGHAIQRAGAEHRRSDRQLQEELQGHVVVHHGRQPGKMDIAFQI
jgi:nitrous-oxide reductase